MTEIREKIKVLKKELKTKPCFEVFTKVVTTIVSMSGQKTMKNISRWSELSYKTVERFFQKNHCWLSINLSLLSSTLKRKELILAADQSNITKSGKKTYGLERFYEPTEKRVVKCLSCMFLSILDVVEKKSYLVYSEQIVFSDAEKQALREKKKKKAAAKGGKRGRPKGIKSVKREVEIPRTFRILKDMLEKFFSLSLFKIKYFVGDIYYGNTTCIRICNSLGMSLVSRFKLNTALFFKHQGNSKVGRKKKYGAKIEIDSLPEQYLVSNEANRLVYQIRCLNKNIDVELNVVIIHQKQAKKVKTTVLFSTDLHLSAQKIIEYYSCRFKIEFNFRDAKEFWGLEDFMNIKKKRIHNAVNLSCFMVNLSSLLIHDYRVIYPNFSVRDLISVSRMKFYTRAILKLIGSLPNNFLLQNKYIIPYSYGAINI